MKYLPKIAQKFRHYKSVTIVVALIIISTQLWVGYRKEAQNTHYLKTVGICNQQTTIKIYDETGGIDPFITEIYEGEQSLRGNLVRLMGIIDPSIPLRYDEVRGRNGYYNQSLNTLENQYFQNYVTTISKYVFAKVDAMGQCQETFGKPQVELVFVYRPAISRGIIPFDDFSPTKSQNTKFLDSPWVKLTIDKSSKLNVRDVFIWNERQFLLDQASIEEGRVLGTLPPMPIALETFNRWESEYHDATPMQEVILAKKLPADIGWLFKNAMLSDSCSICGEARCGLKRIMEETDKLGYTDLNKATIDQLFASANNEIRYHSILDLKNVFNINKYQIDSF